MSSEASEGSSSRGRLPNVGRPVGTKVWKCWPFALPLFPPRLGATTITISNVSLSMKGTGN